MINTQRKPLDYHEEYRKLQNRAKSISIALGKHENKNLVKVSFPIVNYRKVSIDGKYFYYAGTNIFLGIVEEVLISARNMFPLNFGSGNAVSVLHAINKNRFLHTRLKDAIRIYRNENFIWIYDNVNDSDDNRILRIDLFRQLKKIPHKKRKWDFTGGLFHALKHFSIDGKPLSTGNDINDVESVEYVIILIIKAFFMNDGEFDDDAENYTVLLKLNEKYNLKFVFYREINTKVYFVKTIYKVKNKRF